MAREPIEVSFEDDASAKLHAKIYLMKALLSSGSPSAARIDVGKISAKGRLGYLGRWEWQSEAGYRWSDAPETATSPVLGGSRSAMAGAADRTYGMQ